MTTHTPPSLADLDIIRASRKNDYDLDVYVAGEWVASAKNNHAADDTAHEVWYRAVLDQPRCPTCGGEGDCPDCDPIAALPLYTPVPPTYAPIPAFDLPAVPTLEVNWTSSPVAIATPPDIPDETPPITEGDPEDPGEWRNPHAVTLTSLAIDAALVRNRLCANCDGPHFTWRCPEIARLLFAPEPWKDIALGRELCRMRWIRFEEFRKLIASVTRETLLSYAASYQAYIRSYRPDTDLTISQVLEAWAKISAPALLERAA